MENSQKDMEHSGTEHEVIGLLLAQSNGTGSSGHLTTLTSGDDSGNDHITSENGHTSVNVQAVTLADGTTAFIQHNPEGFQAVQLEDGTTAYIAHTTADSLFEGSVDPNTLNLEFTPQSDLTGSPSRISSRALALGEKAFRCSYEGCDRLYTTQHHLKVHERSHTGERPFKCIVSGCGKAFATGYGLKSHTRVHTGEKPYKCPEETCDKAFKTSGDLQKHVRTHTGERPFKCPFEGCDRSFTTSNILKVHIRTHTGERPYVCQEEGCGRSFASATNYKNHVRIHTGEKPYVCTVQGCGKRFTEYSSLYKHHVVHTHSKPYTCSHCGKNYRQTSTLAMHIRTAHGVVDGSEDGTMPQSSQDQDESTGELSDKRSRLHYEDETVHTQQITMITAADVTDDATIAALQAAHQAVDQHNDEPHQILVVSDPSQLVALQLAQSEGSSTGKTSPLSCSLAWTDPSARNSSHTDSAVLITGPQ